MLHLDAPRIGVAVVSILLAPLFVVAAIEAIGPQDKRTLKDRPLETPVEWSIDAVPGPRKTTPPAMPTAGGFVSIQVNVDEFGDNILNDAGNEPSIAVDPTAPNRMVIGWRQFDTINNSFRQGGWGYSNDGGRSWTFPGVLEPGVFRSDPVLDSGNDGTFYYYSLRGDFFCHMFISQDSGVTWEGPTPAFGGDKAWITVDKTGGSGEGNIYVAWSTAGNPHFPNQFTRSTNGGAAWMSPIQLPAQMPRWGTLAVNRDSTLYISGTDGSTFYVIQSTNAKNADQTPIFDSIVEVDLGGEIVLGAGPNPAGLLGQVWVAIDTSEGPTADNIYLLCSVDPPGPDPLDVMFARSEDGGQTWSAPVRVNDDSPGTNAWQWFGTMSVAPNGRIDVIWNDTRNSGQARLSELFYSSSTDGGVTWSVNSQLSPVFDSWIGWPQQNKLGDYYDMISDDVGANLAWAATFNGEQDVYYLRIGDYDCNGNGIGDTDDLANGDLFDCNENGIPDACEIAAGTLPDKNGNGIPDECECPWDFDDSGDVGVKDLLFLLGAWGPCPPKEDCPADFDDSGDVGLKDLLDLLGNWGPCP